jgi:hypothetical protein
MYSVPEMVYSKIKKYVDGGLYEKNIYTFHSYSFFSAIDHRAGLCRRSRHRRTYGTKDSAKE